MIGMNPLKSTPIWDGYRRGRGVEIAKIAGIAKI
jgi:hypothetical protein